MANHKQAKKRILINARKRLRNQAIRSAVKTAFKKARAAIEKEDTEAAQRLVYGAIRAIDKAACKGVVHKNTAARKKSRLMKHYNKTLVEAANG